MIDSTHRDPRARSLTREELSMPLTPSQFEIVRQPPKARLLVTAGPGTGKTHVLIARLEALVRQYSLRPGSQLLVLSFSRAAVKEVRDRLKAVGDDVAYVRAYTFDSFATRLLSRFDPLGPWVEEGYDARIEAAIELLSSNKEAREHLERYLHILVDEVQDLVGVRADFVLEILRSIRSGFTLLGDPAQGIYNFALKDAEARRIGSQALYAAVRVKHGGSLQDFVLYENHRINTESADAFFGPASG